MPINPQLTDKYFEYTVMGLICQKQYDESIGKMRISTSESTKVFNELINALRVKEKKMEW